MIEVVVSIEVDRPSAEVFRYWADWSNNPTWQQGMKRCEWTSEPPLRLGSTYDQVAEFLGRKIVSSFEVVEYEPDAKMRITTTKSMMPLDITREVRPTSAGSQLTATIRGEPQGAMKLLGPLNQRMVERSVNADYQRLRALLQRGDHLL